MLQVNQLIGFGAGAEVTPVVIQNTANPTKATVNGFTATFSAVGIGAEAPSRIVVVACTFESSFGNQWPQSCTIGGVSANALTLRGNTSNSITTRLFYLAVPTGTTATVVVTFNDDSEGDCKISVYSVTAGAYYAQGGDTSIDMDASDPLTTGAISIPENGGFLAVVIGNTDVNAKTWSGATESVDEDAGNHRHTTAIKNGGGSVTVTCQGTQTSEYGAMAWMTFEPI